MSCCRASCRYPCSHSTETGTFNSPNPSLANKHKQTRSLRGNGGHRHSTYRASRIPDIQVCHPLCSVDLKPIICSSVPMSRTRNGRNGLRSSGSLRSVSHSLQPCRILCAQSETVELSMSLVSGRIILHHNPIGSR
jgi:hypothetical protein